MRREKKDIKKRKKSRLIAKRRNCRFCADRKLTIDYKDAKLLQPFLSERGRLVARRISGNCSQHQREVTIAVKCARILALLPFTSIQLRLE